MILSGLGFSQAVWGWQLNFGEKRLLEKAANIFERLILKVHKSALFGRIVSIVLEYLVPQIQYVKLSLSSFEPCPTLAGGFQPITNCIIIFEFAWLNHQTTIYLFAMPSD